MRTAFRAVPIRAASIRFAVALLCLATATLTGCGPSHKELLKIEEQAKYHYDLAYGYYFDTTNSNANAALAEVLKSLDVKEDQADSHLLAGLILMGREDFVGAVRHFKRARAVRPNFHMATNNLGTTYLAMGQWDDSIPLFTALTKDPTYRWPGHAHNNLGWAFYQKGQLELAIKHFKFAILQSPKLCQSYNNLAMVYLDRDDVEQADKYIGRGVTRCPNYAEAYLQRARVQMKQRRPNDAAESLQVCMKLAGDAPLYDKCNGVFRALAGAR